MYPLITLDKKDHPRGLRELPDPPKSLTLRGNLPPPDIKLLTVVGSRRYTNYGAQVVEHLLSGLAGSPIGIVSGLALGIDSLAHELALRFGMYTLAIPGSGIDDKVIYPRRHRGLAKRIMDNGGGLLSEFEPDFKATPWSFLQRNRLMAGISEATLLIEASQRSGTMSTARLTVEYDRELLVVPGNIFSPQSAGGHLFLKLGAVPITEPMDILNALNIQKQDADTQKYSGLSAEEETLLKLLKEPKERDIIIQQSGLSAMNVNIILSELEIKGLVSQIGGQYRSLY